MLEFVAGGDGGADVEVAAGDFFGGVFEDADGLEDEAASSCFRLYMILCSYLWRRKNPCTHASRFLTSIFCMTVGLHKVFRFSSMSAARLRVKVVKKTFFADMNL